MNFDWFVEIYNKVIPLIKNLKEKKDEEDKLKNIVPFYHSRILAISSIYSENDELKKTIRDYYIELIHKNGNNIVKKSLIKIGLQNLYEDIIKKPVIDISKLPLFSFLLQFTFILATSYISRDDEEFYIHENPIRKDKILKIPLISASNWKGNLRWVATKLFVENLPEKIERDDLKKYFEERSQIIRLFGYEKDTLEDYLNSVIAEKLPGEFKQGKEYIEKEFKNYLNNKGYMSPKIEGRRGRLYFFPTYFDKIGLNVINPHSRKTRAGTHPIYFENIPSGSEGLFTLLYIPFDLISKPINMLKEEFIKDLELIVETIVAMMLTYGFSAKKDSGFGIVESNLKNGTLKIKGIISDIRFNNFSELKERISNVKNLIENYGRGA